MTVHILNVVPKNRENQEASAPTPSAEPRTALTARNIVIPKISNNRFLQASGDLPYRFEELSIEVVPGLRAGMFNGTARVTWWDEPEAYNGFELFVNEIILDCVDAKGTPVEETLEEESALYRLIWAELSEGSRKDAVEARVEEDRA